MNKTKTLLLGLLLAGTQTMMGQGAKNIIISEVLTHNTQSIVDEFGNREAWIELANTSYSTYNVRGMYLTTDRAVLNKDMSVPERVSRMSLIPSGENRTEMGAMKNLVLFCNSNPTQGKLHLTLNVPEGKPVWVALYNGNAIELIDSVTVPALGADCSYACYKGRWSVKAADCVTPGIANHVAASETKVEKFKREDPHGIAMAIMAMGIVFSCLALLWIFFSIFGAIMRRMAKGKEGEKEAKVQKKDGFAEKETGKEVYLAVIAMALKQYQDDVHDLESGVITIKPKNTGWDDGHSQMTHFHDPIIPTQHNTPTIPTTKELH